jgi:hypothetical protein
MVFRSNITKIKNQKKINMFETVLPNFLFRFFVWQRFFFNIHSSHPRFYVHAAHLLGKCKHECQTKWSILNMGK